MIFHRKEIRIKYSVRETKISHIRDKSKEKVISSRHINIDFGSLRFSTLASLFLFTLAFSGTWASSSFFWHFGLLLLMVRFSSRLLFGDIGSSRLLFGDFLIQVWDRLEHSVKKVGKTPKRGGRPFNERMVSPQKWQTTQEHVPNLY